MNKLMQGGSIDKKPTGINSIRNNTNRSNAGGFALGPSAKDASGNPKSSLGTPSSTLNSHYHPSKKSKRPQQLEVRRSSKNTHGTNSTV